jgi:hypothetical protein
LLGAGAYIPEESFSSLDLKMPSYNFDSTNKITEPVVPKNQELENSLKEKANLVAKKKAEKMAKQAVAKEKQDKLKAAASNK